MNSIEKTPLLQDGGQKNGLKNSQTYKVLLLMVVACIFCSAYHILRTMNSLYIYSIVSLKYGLLHSGNASNESTSGECNSAENNTQSDKEYHQEQQAAQDESSMWLLYFGIATGIPGTLACALFGSYSDSIGRKILFLLATFGLLARTMCYVVTIHWKLPLEYLYIGYILEGVGGSYYAGLLAVYVSAADITTPTKSRTLMIIVVEVFRYIAEAGAEEMTGQMIAMSGYFLPAVIVAGLFTFNAIVILALLPETRPQTIKKSELSPTKQFRMVLSFVLDRHSSIGTPRALYWLGTSTLFMYFIGILGVIGVEKMFMLNSPLCWNSIQIGTYEAIKKVAWPLGTVILVFVMQRCCADESIAIFVGLSEAAWLGIMAFATTDAMMYIALAAGSLGMGFGGTIRSIMSKATQPEKQGALLASIAVIESFLAMGGTVLSNAIYQVTLPLMKGAVFLFSTGTILVAVVLLFVMNVKYPRKKRIEERTLNIQVEDDPNQ